MKKSTLLVLAIILIPIVIFGAVAIGGASNLPEEQHEGGGGENETLNGTGEFIVPMQVTHEYQIVVPLEAMARA